MWKQQVFSSWLTDSNLYLADWAYWMGKECNELRPLPFSGLYLLFYFLWPFQIRAAWVDDLIVFLQHYVVTVFSGWMVFSPSAGPGHVLIAGILTHASWHMLPHLLDSIFSKCLPRACKFQPRACTILTHDPWHMVPHLLVLLSTCNHSWMCLVLLWILDACFA